MIKNKNLSVTRIKDQYEFNFTEQDIIFLANKYHIKIPKERIHTAEQEYVYNTIGMIVELKEFLAFRIAKAIHNRWLESTLTASKQ